MFFIDEKYQKRVVSYVRRIEEGYKQAVKNLIIQRDGKDFFDGWDFDLHFTIPENNEDTMRVKNAKVDYVNSLLDLIDKVEQSNGRFNYDAISAIIDEDVEKLMNTEKDTEK